MVDFEELYSQLKGDGIRVKHGELVIPGFSEAEYDELFYMLCEELSDFFAGNYWCWYASYCRKYHRYKEKHAHTFDFYDPHMEEPVENHTIRMQLAVLRYFVYKMRYNPYWKKKKGA